MAGLCRGGGARLDRSLWWGLMTNVSLNKKEDSKNLTMYAGEVNSIDLFTIRTRFTKKVQKHIIYLKLIILFHCDILTVTVE